MLTDQQLAQVKAAILAETDPAFVAYLAQGALGACTDIFNEASTFVVWRKYTDVDGIFEAVVWANLTPQDVADGSVAYTNRALACQGKQFNLQTMLTGRDRLATGRASIRSALQDALTNIPAGSGGANIAAGWVAVRTAMQRKATRFEKVFATGTGTATTPGDLVVEGPISYDDFAKAFYLP